MVYRERGGGSGVSELVVIAVAAALTKEHTMNKAGFGGSVFLIALGAILAFAVSVDAEGFNLNTIGYILMAAGALGAVLTLVSNNATQREEHTEYVKKDVDVDTRDR
jgi:hypothetical protein